MANKKCRTWTFILYPEDEGYNDLVDYLKTNNCERIRGYYITHISKPKINKDTGEIEKDENGNDIILKEHSHFVVNFPTQRTANGVVKSLCLYKDEVNENEESNSEKKPVKVEPVSDISSMYYYTLHWTYACQRENKERYEEKDITPLGNDSNDFILSCRGERDLTSRVTCVELLQRSETSKDCKTLLMNCVDDEHLVKFMLKNPYFVKQFIVGGFK